MRRHVTHNRFQADFRELTAAIFGLLGETLSREREAIAETVTDGFRVVTRDRSLSDNDRRAGPSASDDAATPESGPEARSNPAYRV